MPTCNRCNEDVGILGRLRFDESLQRCGRCQDQVSILLASHRKEFLRHIHDRVLTVEEYNDLRTKVDAARIPWAEFAAHVSTEIHTLVERTLCFFEADGAVSAEEWHYLENVAKGFELPPEQMAPIVRRVTYVNQLARIRAGDLPTVRTSVHLESAEVCHLQVPASFRSPTTTTTTDDGDLVATNAAVHFLSPSGGWTIDWAHVRQIERERSAVYLGLTRTKGNGYYLVQDPIWVTTVLDATLRVHNRQLSSPTVRTRHIPQLIKTAVYHRDAGRCVECAATDNLEFDHIIPFSKGGANSTANIQMLCRPCNLKKSDRL